MRFAVLGPLAVSPDEHPVSLGGRKQRTLLAILLLHANEIVSRDRLIDALWGQSPPPSASESLDTYVYRLRKLLGHNRLLRQTGGYLLRVESGELDADRFELLLARAGRASKTGDHRAATAALAEALALWHGPAWADMLDEPSAAGEAQRLEELRLSAVESRIEAELAMGRGGELVPELHQLVAGHPLRERLVRCLMVALYRAGRQTDALDAFQAARQHLVDALGLEPGPDLHELQRRILQHDPLLKGPHPGLPTSGTRGRRKLAVAVALVLGAVLTAGLLLSLNSPHSVDATLAGANGVVAVNTASGQLVATTPLTGAPEAVGSGAGSVWATGPGGVTRIDPSSGAAVDQILAGGEPGSIALGGGAIWMASTVGATVTRIDPETESVTQKIPLPGSGLGAIGFGLGRLWVTDPAADVLFEVDPATGSLERTVSLNVEPDALAIGDGAVWVAGYDDATVEKIDPTTGKVTGRVRVGDGPSALVFAAGSLWVANSLDSTVSRIDPGILAVRALIPVGSGPAALADGAGSVWVANQYSGTVSRIDPRRDRVTASVKVGGAPTSLIMTRDRIWAGVAANSGSHRGGTLVIAAPGELTSSKPTTLTSVDPAWYNLSPNPLFTGLAYDALVNFQQSPGAAGMRLVPDLALAIPAPTDGGRAYAFRIRPGIRYSDGEPLRPSDFRRGIERLFRVGSPGTSLFSGIVGAAACARHPADCDLSRGIVTDDDAGTGVPPHRARPAVPVQPHPERLRRADPAGNPGP